MAAVQPPPTYAEVVIVDESTKRVQFNPIWLKWFVDLVQTLDDAGGSTIEHNNTDNIQGGAASERYHFTSAQHTALAAVVAGTREINPPTPAGAAQTAVALYAGTGAPDNADGADGDFYFRSDGTVGADTVIYHKEAGAWVALVTS